MKLGAAKNPGPGFMPAVIGVLLFLCTSVYLRKAFRRAGSRDGGGDQEDKQRAEYGVVIGTLASVILYPVLLTHLKFLVSTFLLLFVLLRLLRYRGLLFSFALAFGIAMVSFVVFSRLLGVGLPMGFLEALVFRVGR